MFLAAAAGFLISRAMPPTYSASTSLLAGSALSSPSFDYSQSLVSQSLAQTYADIALTRPVVEVAATAVGISADEAARQVSSAVPTGTSFVVITTTDHDAVRAAALANALAAALVAQAPKVDANSEVSKATTAALATLDAQVAAMQARINQLAALPTPTAAEAAELLDARTRIAALGASRIDLIKGMPDASATNSIEVVDPAVTPTSPTGPRVLLNTGLAAVLGFFASIGLAYIFEILIASGVVSRRRGSVAGRGSRPAR